jgi:hypothetical protein
MLNPFRCVALTALFISPIAAQAQSVDWHVGIGVTSELDGRGPFDFDADAEDGRTVVVGARFDNGFGVEAAYVDLGQILSPGIADAGFVLDGELWSVGATWGRRIERLEPYAKLGWFSREDDGISISIIGPAPLTVSDDGFMAEAGLRWYVTDPFALRLACAHYDFERDSDGSAQLLAEWHF